MFCALIRYIQFVNRQANALECMKLSLLCTNHQYLLTTYVAILGWQEEEYGHKYNVLDSVRK